jgi:hypothetical protein
MWKRNRATGAAADADAGIVADPVNDKPAAAERHLPTEPLVVPKHDTSKFVKDGIDVDAKGFTMAQVILEMGKESENKNVDGVDNIFGGNMQSIAYLLNITKQLNANQREANNLHLIHNDVMQSLEFPDAPKMTLFLPTNEALMEFVMYYFEQVAPYIFVNNPGDKAAQDIKSLFATMRKWFMEVLPKAHTVRDVRTNEAAAEFESNLLNNNISQIPFFHPLKTMMQHVMANHLIVGQEAQFPTSIGMEHAEPYDTMSSHNAKNKAAFYNKLTEIGSVFAEVETKFQGQLSPETKEFMDTFVRLALHEQKTMEDAFVFARAEKAYEEDATTKKGSVFLFKNADNDLRVTSHGLRHNASRVKEPYNVWAGMSLPMNSTQVSAKVVSRIACSNGTIVCVDEVLAPLLHPLMSWVSYEGPVVREDRIPGLSEGPGYISVIASKNP